MASDNLQGLVAVCLTVALSSSSYGRSGRGPLSYLVDALNLTADLFPLLTPDQAIKDVWGARIDAFVQRQNRGYAFSVLARNAPRWEAGMTVSDWITVALNRSGLPPINELFRRGE